MILISIMIFKQGHFLHCQITRKNMSSLKKMANKFFKVEKRPVSFNCLKKVPFFWETMPFSHRVTNGPSHEKSPHFYVEEDTTTVHIRSHTNHEHNDEQWAFAANSQLLFKNINNKEGNLDQGIPKMVQLFFLRKRLNSGNPLFIVCFSLFLGAILDWHILKHFFTPLHLWSQESVLR